MELRQAAAERSIVRMAQTEEKGKKWRHRIEEIANQISVRHDLEVRLGRDPRKEE
jgi:hypothetical protein